MVWYDATPNKPTTEKIREAIAAYVNRFTLPPDVVLVNSVDEAEVAGVAVRSERTVQANNFWVGRSEEQA
jgi:hypothetical protein